MTHNDEPGIPQVRFGPIKWLSSPLRAPIEEAVSEYRGRKWRIGDERDLSEFACHHCAIVSDGSSAVFFKYSEAVDAKRQFEVELSGLQTLSKRAGVLIPQPIRRLSFCSTAGSCTICAPTRLDQSVPAPSGRRRIWINHGLVLSIEPGTEDQTRLSLFGSRQMKPTLIAPSSLSRK